MENNRNEAEESTQQDIFGDEIHQVISRVGNTFDRHSQEHVEQFLKMLAPNPEAYAYALLIFGHIVAKIKTIRETYPRLLPVVFADIAELTAAIANNPKLHDARSNASALGSYYNQPDTEGRAHKGALREHALSAMLWDSGQPGYHSVSDAFGGFLILGNAAATPSCKADNNILLAASRFRRALGIGKGTVKLGGNILQRIDRILKNSIGLVHVHGALIKLQHQFPAEEGIAELVHGMALIVEMLPKFASASVTKAKDGDVQLPRLFMRLTKQSGIDTRALDKALYEIGSILFEQADSHKRNEPQEVDLYAAFGVANTSGSTADMVERYLRLELQSKIYGWAAGIEAVRPGSGEYLSADCRCRLGRHLQEEVDSDCCSVGGLILLLVMFLNKEADSVYDTQCGFECAIGPEGRIRRTDLAIDPSDALENAPPETVRHASGILGLNLPELGLAYIEKHLAECKWGESVGAHLGLSREQFRTEYENKIAEIRVEHNIHELRIDGMGYQLGLFAYNGCRSTSVINSLYGLDRHLPTNSAHYVWIGDAPLSDWHRAVGEAYFRGDEVPPILDFEACANSQTGIGATVPEISHLGRFIRTKQGNLKRLHTKRRTKRIEYLNELAQFLQFILQCVTSCHKNTDAFALFSVRTSRYENFTTLADKVSHYFDDGRLVVFTDVVRRWIEHYLAEISHLVPWLEEMGAEESALYLRSLLHSVEHKTSPGIPFFFQMGKHDYAITSLTALVQREWLGDEFKWGNVNELRKVLGTYLFERGVSQDLMSFQMGHIVSGLHPFNSSSFWCVSQAIEALSPVLDRYCRELGIRPPADPMTRSSAVLSKVDLSGIEPLWVFAEHKNRSAREKVALQALESIGSMLDQIERCGEMGDDITPGHHGNVLNIVAEELVTLKKYGLEKWKLLVKRHTDIVERLELQDTVRKVYRVEKKSVLSGHRFASEFDVAVDLIYSCHATLDRDPVENCEVEIYEILVDFYLLQITTGALINFELFEACVTQKLAGLTRNRGLAYWDIYPTKSKLRPMRVIVAPIACRVLEVIQAYAPNGKIAELNYDIATLKRRFSARLRSVGVTSKSGKQHVEKLINVVQNYWSFHLPAPILNYYRHPYSVTPTNRQNLYRAMHSGRVPPLDRPEVQARMNNLCVLRLVPSTLAKDDLGDSLTNHVSSCVKVIDDILVEVGDLRLGDSGKIKECRRRLEMWPDLYGQSLPILHRVSEAALYAVQSFVTVGTITKKIADRNYPRWKTVLRYWSVVKKLALLQADREIDLMDSDEISRTIESLIEHYSGRNGKKRLSSNDTESTALLNYALACMDEGLIAKVNPDVFKSLGGQLLPSVSGVLTVYEREEILRLVWEARALDESERNCLLLYLILHFLGAREEAIMAARPSDVMLTRIDGAIRWISLNTRAHENFVPKTPDSNVRNCPNPSSIPEYLKVYLDTLEPWLANMQAEGVTRIFHDDTAAGYKGALSWFYTQVKLIAREFLGDPGFSGHQLRHSAATVLILVRLIVRGSPVSDIFIANTSDYVSDDSGQSGPDNWSTADPHRMNSVPDMLGHAGPGSSFKYYFSAPEIVLHTYLYNLLPVGIPVDALNRMGCGRIARNATLKKLLQKPVPGAVPPEHLNARADRQALPFFGPSDEYSISLINRVLSNYAKSGRSIDILSRSESIRLERLRNIIDMAVAAEHRSAFTFFRLTGPALEADELEGLGARMSHSRYDFERAQQRMEAYISTSTREELHALHNLLHIWVQERSFSDSVKRLQVAGLDRLQALLSLLDLLGQDIGKVVVCHPDFDRGDLEDVLDHAPLVAQVSSFMKSPHQTWVARGQLRRGVYSVILAHDRNSTFLFPVQLQRFILVLFVYTSIQLAE